MFQPQPQPTFHSRQHPQSTALPSSQHQLKIRPQIFQRPQSQIVPVPQELPVAKPLPENSPQIIQSQSRSFSPLVSDPSDIRLMSQVRHQPPVTPPGPPVVTRPRPQPQVVTLVTPGAIGKASLPAPRREQKSITTQETDTQPQPQNQRSTLFQSLLAQKEERARRLMSILNEIGTPEKSSLKQPSLTFEDEIKPQKEIDSSVVPVPASIKATSVGLGNNVEIVIANAKTAVDKRKSLARSRSSPEVWAAVRILSEFVTSSDIEVSVPDNILTAIILLTDFLDEDTKDVNHLVEVESQVPVIQKLSLTQENIKARILTDKQNQRNRIAEILKMKMIKDIMMMDPDELLYEQETDGFAFATLPIV